MLTGKCVLFLYLGKQKVGVKGLRKDMRNQKHKPILNLCVFHSPIVMIASNHLGDSI